MPTKTQALIAAVVTSSEVRARIPKLRGIKLLKSFTSSVVGNYKRIVVSARLTDLPDISHYIREANDRHHLRQLLVFDSKASNLLPQYMTLSNLRSLRNIIVHTNTDVPLRVLKAQAMGSERELIADARVADSELVVISCAGDSYVLPLSKVRHLSGASESTLDDFSIDEDGSYIYWEDLDVHIDLQTIRELVDPLEREKARHAKLQSDALLGRAIAEIRKSRRLRQSDVPGLSARQVRRIESGNRPRVSTLGLIAEAHGLETNAYLDEVAEVLQKLKSESQIDVL